MTHPMRTNQKFIESVILYEVNNWTPIDEISENLRKLFGKEVFENDRKLDSKSSSFLSELSVESITKFVKDIDVKDIDSIRKDQKFVRSVILYELLIGEKNMDKIYKKLLRRIGSDIIDYPVYSHWYDQFKSGNYDFDDDSLSSKSPTFSDLLMDAIEIVVEKLELKEQLTLRKVSRNLRNLVDKNAPAYKIIRITSKPDFIHITFNDLNVMYCDTDFDEMVYKTKLIKSTDYLSTAFDDVAIALKNPKLQLELLKFDYLSSDGLPESMSGNENAEKIYEKMRNLLETLNHKISVKEFSMMTKKPKELISILRYLKPGALEVIEVRDGLSRKNTNFDVDKIAALDQWKYAKDVKINASISSSIDHILHFNRFVINLSSISTEDLIRIKDNLQSSMEFQYCNITFFNMPTSEIMRIFDLKTSPRTGRLMDRDLSIPNSNEFFEIKMIYSSLSIQRKSHWSR